MSENEVELRSELQELENIEENDGADDESIADDLSTISSHGVDQTAEVLISKIRVRTHNQNMTVAARAIADKKPFGQRS